MKHFGAKNETGPARPRGSPTKNPQESTRLDDGKTAASSGSVSNSICDEWIFDTKHDGKFGARATAALPF
jgi:hypothetical protein